MSSSLQKIYGKVFLLVIFSIVTTARAEIMLPAILSDNMVLQRNSTVKLWGWKTTQPNGEVRIFCSWSSDTIRTKAIMGAWRAEIKTPEAGGVHSIQLESDFEAKTITNILIGEVWLGSGQSNMEMPVDSIFWDFPGVVNFKEEINNASFPEIRLFLVKLHKSSYPQLDLKGEWVVCRPETVGEFSGVAYFFAKKLYEELNVPIGMIASSWGGTNAETWIGKKVLSQKPGLMEPFKDLNTATGWYPGYPGECYNAMIYPLRNFTLKGVIWYQGESNRNRPTTYPSVMETLISSWRTQWGFDFPFYFTQIAPFKYNNGVPAQYIMEAQKKCLEINKTGMAVTTDVGNLDHIHPKDKRTVGERLALLALAKDYNKDVPFSGPVFSSMTTKGKKVILSFDYASGLQADQETLTLFEIAGADSTFYPAIAKISGENIIVSSQQVRKPVAVRFAFSETAQAQLYNSVKLPAAPFRTDNWPFKP